jgi:hypothetical protein
LASERISQTRLSRVSRDNLYRAADSAQSLLFVLFGELTPEANASVGNKAEVFKGVLGFVTDNLLAFKIPSRGVLMRKVRYSLFGYSTV